MLKYLNIKKLFKNNNKLKLSNRFKAFTLATALSATLVGCNTNNSNKEYTKYTNEDIQAMIDIEVDVNYNNYNDEIYKKKKIYFTYDNTAYNAVNITHDGTAHTHIKNIDGHIYSSYLKKQIDVPKANEDEKIIVNVDYQDKTLEAHTEKLEKENTK